MPESGGGAETVRLEGPKLSTSLLVVFDGSLDGIPEAADVDAVHWDSAGTRLWMSFDRTVRIGGPIAEDEDVLS